MSGMSFSLPGNKRFAVSGKAAAVKKPTTVNDLFSQDSDEEEGVPANAKRPRTNAPSVSSAGVTSALDAETKRVADKLADFVAKNGRSFEEMTKQRNPGETPFKFLFDKSSPGYRYYNSKVEEFIAAQGRPGAAPAALVPAPPTTGAPRPPPLPPMHPADPFPGLALQSPHSALAPPPSATYAPRPPPAPYSPMPPPQQPAAAASSSAPEAGKQLTAEDIASRTAQAVATANSLAAMDAYMKAMEQKEKDRLQAAEDEAEHKRRMAEPLLNETAFDRRRVTAVYKTDGNRGHHMQDFIPPEELAKFMAKGGDEAAIKQAEHLANKNAIKSDNIGHKLLQKMGWKEGEGIGGSQKGIAAPIKAADMKQDNLGLGAAQHGEVEAGDDVFEQYRKRMMLGYKFRPNPLGNPRKQYY